MKSSTKLALGVVLAVLVVGTLAATVYAAPLATQDRLRNRAQTRDPTQCPNFVDQNGDGICDNCPRVNGTGLGGQHQYRHGWGG